MMLQDLAHIESRINSLEHAMEDIDENRVCQIRLQKNPQGSWQEGYGISNLTPEFLADIRKHIEIQRDEVRRDFNQKIRDLKEK